MVKSGASVPPEVPLPSAIDQETNFSRRGRPARLMVSRPERMCVDVVVADAQRVRRDDSPTSPTASPPSAGHHIQWMGSFSKASSTQ